MRLAIATQRKGKSALTGEVLMFNGANHKIRCMFNGASHKYTHQVLFPLSLFGGSL